MQDSGKLSIRDVSVDVAMTKGKGRAVDIAPQVDTATTEALRYMARTKQRRTYLPYTFPATAGQKHATCIELDR